MALSDYHLCARCGSKAFYDADIRDAGYVATYDPSEGDDPIAIAALCTNCAKSHTVIVVERATAPAPAAEGRE